MLVIGCYGSLITASLFVNVMHQEASGGSVVVKALCHKPEGRGFETR
jgi:hypothetical protein